MSISSAMRLYAEFDVEEDTVVDSLSTAEEGVRVAEPLAQKRAKEDREVRRFRIVHGQGRNEFKFEVQVSERMCPSACRTLKGKLPFQQSPEDCHSKERRTFPWDWVMYKMVLSLGGIDTHGGFLRGWNRHKHGVTTRHPLEALGHEKYTKPGTY